ncbi:hypothetical protein [Clostridium saccharoperbutylacetonicum]
MISKAAEILDRKIGIYFDTKKYYGNPVFPATKEELEVFEEIRDRYDEDFEITVDEIRGQISMRYKY